MKNIQIKLYFSVEHDGVLAVSRGVGVGVVEWSGHGLNADEPQGASQRVVMLCGRKNTSPNNQHQSSMGIK